MYEEEYIEYMSYLITMRKWAAGNGARKQSGRHAKSEAKLAPKTDSQCKKKAAPKAAKEQAREYKFPNTVTEVQPEEGSPKQSPGSSKQSPRCSTIMQSPSELETSRESTHTEENEEDNMQIAREAEEREHRLQMLNELRNLQKELPLIHVKNQLREVFKFLKKTGDAIAVLPRGQHTLGIKLWFERFERHRTVRAKFTVEDKDALLLDGKRVSLMENFQTPQSDSKEDDSVWDSKRWIKKMEEKRLMKLHAVEQELSNRFSEFAPSNLTSYYNQSDQEDIEQSGKAYYQYMGSTEADDYIYKGLKNADTVQELEEVENQHQPVASISDEPEG